jgi:hypothetical protein
LELFSGTLVSSVAEGTAVALVLAAMVLWSSDAHP